MDAGDQHVFCHIHLNAWRHSIGIRMHRRSTASEGKVTIEFLYKLPFHADFRFSDSNDRNDDQHTLIECVGIFAGKILSDHERNNRSAWIFVVPIGRVHFRNIFHNFFHGRNERTEFGFDWQ